MESQNDALQDETITCLVRGEDRVAKLRNYYGGRVNPVLFESLDDTEKAIEVASHHDIVINTTLGFHPESANALVKGLAKRKKATGKDVYMIHTSGTSNYADQPISKRYIERDSDREYDDEKDDIYTYWKQRNDQHPYGQRTSALCVIDAGDELGVKIITLTPPTIYGIGTGYFNKHSVQIPAYTKATLKNGHGVIVGEGTGVWDNVHVEDLADLYTIVLLNILEKHGADLSFNKKGIIHSGTERHHWIDIAKGVAEAAYEEEAITTPEVKSLTLQEAAATMPSPYDSETRCEISLSSNSRTKASVAKKLGWKPSRGKQAFQAGFVEEVEAALAKA